jgi:hypothetical protein
MTEKELIERLSALIEKGKAFHVCKVLEVNGMNCLVQPDNGDVEIGAKLSLVDNPDFLIVPEVGSYVIVAERRINKSERQYFIIYCTRAQSIKLNGDQFGGLVKADVLKAELDKTNEVVNAILSIINGAIVPEPGNGANSALQAAIKGAVIGKAVGNFGSIKNDTIKHG